MPRPDARGWVGISVFTLTVMVLWMVAAFPELREDEFFKVLATAIVLTGFVQGVVGWAYTATKQGGEMADRNMAVVEQVAQTTANTAAAALAPPAPAPANVQEAADQVAAAAEAEAEAIKGDGADPAAGLPEGLK